MTFDGATKDPMQQAMRDALIGFMATLSQAQAEANKEAQRVGIADPESQEGKKLSGAQAELDRGSDCGSHCLDWRGERCLRCGQTARTVTCNGLPDSEISWRGGCLRWGLVLTATG
jgi:hypothetical protein